MAKVNLRKEAKGRECQVRLFGVCNGNAETVVLAHYRMAGLSGIGQKPNDLLQFVRPLQGKIICHC